MTTLNLKNIILLIVSNFTSNTMIAAGGDGPYFSYYKNIIHAFLGLDESSPADALAYARGFEVIPGIILATIVMLITGLIYSKWANNKINNKDYAPSSKVSLAGMVETLLKFILDLTKDSIGAGHKRFAPFLVAIFLFILVNNIMGLTPGLPPATENMSINFGMGLLVFFVYNWAGFKEHGVSYIKQFMGPLLLLAPLIFVIEIISHSVRPLSLSLRLFVSLFADHTIVGVMGDLVPIGVPALLLLFGLLVACIQAFVFVLLSCIYIGMAKSHDH